MRTNTISIVAIVANALIVQCVRVARSLLGAADMMPVRMAIVRMRIITSI